MRPIKFRAWDGKKMVEPGYITPSGWFENFRGLEDGDRSEGPLMQFTGLLDSKGVEIYENSEIDGKYVVEFLGCSYVLRDILTGDIVMLQDYYSGASGNVKITREYQEIQRN